MSKVNNIAKRHDTFSLLVDEQDFDDKPILKGLRINMD